MQSRVNSIFYWLPLFASNIIVIILLVLLKNSMWSRIYISHSAVDMNISRLAYLI